MTESPAASTVRRGRPAGIEATPVSDSMITVAYGAAGPTANGTHRA
ncbi:hypothetical protein ACFVT2_21940 [Streptomyces sp. NPDC058000]